MDGVLTESREREKGKKKEIFSTKDNYNKKEKSEKPEKKKKKRKKEKKREKRKVNIWLALTLNETMSWLCVAGCFRPSFTLQATLIRTGLSCLST